MKHHTKKELQGLYPTSEGWEHLSCTLVSPMTFAEEGKLASLILTGIASTPLEWAYSHQKGKELVIVCRKAKP